MKIFFTILLQVFFLTQTFAINDESIIIELQNNCGKKVELSLELAHNPLNLSLENGLKSKFKLKVGSYIVVNKVKIYQIVKSDEGKLLDYANNVAVSYIHNPKYLCYNCVL